MEQRFVELQRKSSSSLGSFDVVSPARLPHAAVHVYLPHSLYHHDSMHGLFSYGAL